MTAKRLARSLESEPRGTHPTPRHCQLYRQQLLVEQMRQGKYPNSTRMRELLRKKAVDGHYPDKRKTLDLPDEPFDISAKTLKRDVQYLRVVHSAPIMYDAGNKGYYLSNPQWEIPFLDLQGEDVMASLFAGKLVQEIVPPVLIPELGRVQTAVVAAAKTPIPHESQVLSSIVMASGMNVTLRKSVTEAVIRAWQESRALRLRYCTGLKWQGDLEADPHAIFFSEGAWYLRAKCQCKDQSNLNGICSLALHRIEKAEVLDRTFGRDPQIVTDVHKGKLFNYPLVKNVVIRCGPNAIDHVTFLKERSFFPGQESKVLDDGGIEITVPEVAEDLILSWVLAFGGPVVIRQPDALRRRVARAALAMYERHKA